MTRIADWITYDEAQGKEELGGSGGWFGVSETGWNAGHRWNNYLEAYKEVVRLLLEELRRSIIEHHIRCTGYQHQNGYNAVPLWNNGKVATYSFRAGET